jgi:thymidylate kinase
LVKPFIYKADLLFFLDTTEIIWKARLKERKQFREDLENYIKLEILEYRRELMQYIIENYWNFFLKKNQLY